MNRRRTVVGVGLLVAAIALVIVFASTFGQASRDTATGVVIAVDSSGLTDVRGFTIRADNGRTVVFRIGVLENGAQFPPGHLLEHAATGVKVVVTYHVESGEDVAVRIDDAPGSLPVGASPS